LEYLEQPEMKEPNTPDAANPATTLQLHGRNRLRLPGAAPGVSWQELRPIQL